MDQKLCLLAVGEQHVLRVCKTNILESKLKLKRAEAKGGGKKLEEIR